MIPGVYTDEDISPVLAQLLRDKGVDAVSAHDINMLGITDAAHLAYAHQEGRILIAFNKVDFITLSQKTDHSGIIVAQQVPLSGYSGLVERILERLTIVQSWNQILQWV